MRLNKRFSKKIETAENLNGIIVKGNVADYWLLIARDFSNTYIGYYWFLV